MPNFKTLNYRDSIPPFYNDHWVESTKFKSNQRIVDSKGNIPSFNYSGNRYTLISKRERVFSNLEHKLRRLLALFAIIGSVGFAWRAKPIRDLFNKRKETIRYGVLYQSQPSPQPISGRRTSLNKDDASPTQITETQGNAPALDEEAPYHPLILAGDDAVIEPFRDDPDERTDAEINRDLLTLFPDLKDLQKLPLSVKKSSDISGQRWLHSSHLQLIFNMTSETYPTLLLTAYLNLKFHLILDQIRNDLHIVKKENCAHFDVDIDCANKSVFAYPMLLCGNHWTLILVDSKERTIEYYDSKFNYGGLAEQITDELKLFASKLPSHGQKAYTVTAEIPKTLQPDGYQCGIWISYFLNQRLMHPKFDLKTLDKNDAQTMIADYRLKLTRKIIEYEIKSQKEQEERKKIYQASLNP